MDFIFELFQGNEAFDKASKESLTLAWEELIGKQNKLCLFQSPDFVRTWYRSYMPTYTPLLFLAWDTQGQLIGLFPLAIHTEKKYVVCAGDELAEYHGFIADPAYEESFGIRCLEAIKNDFSFSYLRFGWVAPESNTSWISKANLAKRGIYFQLENATDPNWDLQNPAKLKRIKKRANVKRCFRQYAQRGDFRYERILGTDRMEFLLNEFSQQSDFKKEALFNRRLFESDPHIKDFLCALQAFPEISHFSVLWLDDAPIAFNHGYVQGDELCLAGYTSYDPSESRNSPGKLHLIELAEAGKSEGINRIDLTPGKDAYKSRFANDTREVKKMTFYFNIRSKYIANFRLFLKNKGFDFLSKIGITHKQIKFWSTDAWAYLKRLRKSGALGFITLLQACFQRKHAYTVFEVMDMGILPHEMSVKAPYAVKKNDYKDLLVYDEPMHYVSRKNLFQKSLTRFSRGDKLYSLTKDGKLVYLAWLRDGKYELKLPGTKYRHQFPENSRIIYGFCGFGYKIAQRVLDAFYDEIIIECIAGGLTEIYICFGMYDQASQSFAKKRKLEKRFRHVHRQFFYFLHHFSHSEDASSNRSGVRVLA